MRAVRIDEFGGPEVLVPVEVPDPVAGPGQVLVKVAAAGVNRADALVRAGLYHRAGRPPLIPGVEAAGIVAAVGEGVTGLRVGQRVMALDGINAPGFYAEFAVVPATQVTVLPDGVELTEAAALPVAWLSAWYCLRHLAKVTKDDTVVVKAAASGVGSAAVQIAAETGARVIAVAGSPEKTAWAAELGAHVTLDTSAHPDDAEVDEVLRLTEGAARTSCSTPSVAAPSGEACARPGTVGGWWPSPMSRWSRARSTPATSTPRTRPSSASSSPICRSTATTPGRICGSWPIGSRPHVPRTGGDRASAGPGARGPRAPGAARQPGQDRARRRGELTPPGT